MSERVKKIVEKALKSEPKFELGEGFAEEIVKTIRKKEAGKQRRLYVWMTLGCLMILGFGYVILKVYTPETIDGQSLFHLGAPFNKAIPFAIILGLLVVAIQYLDQKLIKEKYLFN